MKKYLIIPFLLLCGFFSQAQQVVTLLTDSGAIHRDTIRILPRLANLYFNGFGDFVSIDSFRTRVSLTFTTTGTSGAATGSYSSATGVFTINVPQYSGTTYTGTANRITITGSVIDIGTDVVTLTGSQTLTNKTLTQPIINSSSSTDTTTYKPFAVSSAGVTRALTYWPSGSGGGTYTGTTNRITVTGTVIDIGTDVVTLTGSQTLTNKTLTSPVINVGSDATGDIYYRNASGLFTRLPVGSNTNVLTLAAGVPSWAAGVGVTTLSAIGATANANGATITGSTLNLQPASNSFGGVVTTGIQSFAGAKTFNAVLAIANNTTDAVTLSGSNAGRISYVAQNTNSAGNASFYFQNDVGGYASYGGVGHVGTTGTGTWFGSNRSNRTFLITDGASSAGLLIGSITSVPVIIGANNTARITMPSAGNVGIGVSSPNSILETTSFATAYRAITALRTLDATDNTIECTSGTFTVTLPTAVGITGREYWITNTGSGTITLATTSSQTFVNVTATPTTLTIAQFTNYKVVSNGAVWLAYKIVN